MSNILTKEAKVRIGFDIDKEMAKNAFKDVGKQAELLEKAIGKAGQKQKDFREEFATSRMQVVTGAMGAVSKAASGMSDEVAKAFSGFSVVTGVIEMFNSLNGSINSAVKSLKEMKAVGATMSTLQGIHYAGGGSAAAAGAAGSVARGVGTSIAGAAAGGALVSAAGQFATSTAASQVKGAIEKAAEKLGDKASDKADKLFDDIINNIVSKNRKSGSSLVPSAGGAPGSGSGFADVTDAQWSFNTQRLIGRDQTTSEYVRAAMLNAGGGGASAVPMSGFGKWLSASKERMTTSFYSPKNRVNFLQGGLAGGLLGGAAGFAVSGGSVEGAAAGGGIGAAVGSIGNVMSGGGLLKGAAALASPGGALLAIAGAAGLSILSAFTGEKSKLGKIADKVFDEIGGFFVDIFSDSKAKEEKAAKRLAAQRAELDRRDSVSQVLIPLQRAREDSLESVRGERSAFQTHQYLMSRGMAGMGLDTSIEYGGQNMSDASSRLIQAQTARYRGVNLGLGGDTGQLKKNEAEALADFQSQFAAQRQLTDTQFAGQLATIDPEISQARSKYAAEQQRLSWMKNRRAMIGPGRGGIKAVDVGFTPTEFADAYEGTQKALEKVISLEKQRGDIKQKNLETQKAEFAVFREQARAGEQAARQALAEKEGVINTARRAFALMSPEDREYAKETGKKLTTSGFESFDDDRKQFAVSNPALFGHVLEPQLQNLGNKVGFGDFQAITDFNAKKEAAGLEAAKNLKIEIERNIVAQLGVNEQRLAQEIVAATGPLYSKLEILIVNKFEELTQAALNKMNANSQMGNINKPPG